MNNTNAALIVLITALVTALLRFLPFRLFRDGRETPPLITYLGKVLPYPVMAMLVVYCLKNVSFRQHPYGLPEAAASLITALLHIWKRNTLLSILIGTVCYCLLIRVL